MTVFTLSEVWATGEKLRAAAATRHEAIELLKRQTGVVTPYRDFIQTERGLRVMVDGTVYTIREVPLGEWQS